MSFGARMSWHSEATAGVDTTIMANEIGRYRVPAHLSRREDLNLRLVRSRELVRASC